MLTITEVSRGLNVSTRMLRYYEQQGLIRSERRTGYAYRMYDEENVSRLRLLLMLRRLRVPLKAIAAILSDCDAHQAVEILRQRIGEVEAEMRSLEAIRQVLTMFVERIGAANAHAALLGDETLMAAVDALGLSNVTLKERVIMSEINHAEKEQWRGLNVRIVMLPPMTVAAFHYIGENCEDHAGAMAEEFIRQSRLYDRKPDSRMLGFNHPNPTQENPVYGYEYWVSIPEEMDVPAPGVKKQFAGGLYAAHAIEFPNFHEWQWLLDWAENSPEWRPAPSDAGLEDMFGSMEEHLNWVWAIHHDRMNTGATKKLDLLLPVCRR